MKIKMIERSALTICGYVVETSLETCEQDLRALWEDFRDGKRKGQLQSLAGSRGGIYGLMWYTQNHRYCYLLGMETEVKETGLNSVCIKRVPEARYAVVSVPSNMSVVEAWTLFFEKVLPEAGYMPDSDHGLYFEYYPDEDSETCELWTPVKELK